MPAPPLVQVIVVAYNSGADLQHCLDALARQSFRDFEAVVWDNASTDTAFETLKPGGARVVRHPENLGFAAGNNRAAELSHSRFIVTLNPDAFAEPDWLERLVAAAVETGAEMAASLQLDDEAPHLLDGAGDCMSVIGVPWRGGYRQPVAAAPKVRCEVFAPCAAAALYRRDAFERAGGFEERFFCYCEDVDLAYRLRLQGARCVLEPRAVVRHRGSGTVRSISGFADYHSARNRLWMFVRDTPLILMPLALPLHAALTLFLITLSASPKARAERRRGLKDGLRGMGPFIAERKTLDRQGSGSVLRTLSWSPLALARRAPVWRPWRAGA